MSSKEKIILFGIVLFLMILLTVGFSLNHDLFYTRAYTPVVEKHRANEASQGGEEKPSKQPKGAGFTEQDINKQHGDGYATY